MDEISFMEIKPVQLISNAFKTRWNEWFCFMTVFSLSHLVIIKTLWHLNVVTSLRNYYVKLSIKKYYFIIILPLNLMIW
jgi:hypothetical protein